MLTSKSAQLTDICFNISPKNAFHQVKEMLLTTGLNATTFSEIRRFLKIAGFSQNDRNRIIHLTAREIEAIYESIPENQLLWSGYVHEIHLLLSKIDQLRKLDPHLGRPYITSRLLFAIVKLYFLRSLAASGFEYVAINDLRLFLMDPSRHEWFISHVNKQDEASEILSGKKVNVQTAIRLMELYRDELLAPPRLKFMQIFNEFEINALETGEYRLMDDGGESYLEAISDIDPVSYYDDLPHFNLVLDWFLAKRPEIDANQFKRGWLYLEKNSEVWHKQSASKDYYKSLCADYPGWRCTVAENFDDWLNYIAIQS